MPPKGSGAGGGATTNKHGEGESSAGGKKSNQNQQQHQAQADRLKVVIRKGPAEIPEAIFWSAVDASLDEGVPAADQVDWRSFRGGRSRQIGQTNKETIESVGYLHFKRVDTLARFATKFQGHTFRDKKGQVSQVVVEYAPFQKIPTAAKKQKADPLAGTIDNDPDYLDFVASLTAEPTAPAIPAANPTATTLVKSTPLLEELRAKKAASLAKRKERGKAEKSSTGRKEEKSAEKDGKGKEKGKKGKAAAAPVSGTAQANGKTGASSQASAPEDKAENNRRDRKERRKEKEKAIAEKAKAIVAKEQGKKAGPAAGKEVQQAAQPKMTILAPPTRPSTISPASVSAQQPTAAKANASAQSGRASSPANAAARTTSPAPSIAGRTNASTPSIAPTKSKPKPAPSASGGAFDFDAVLRTTAQQMSKKPAPAAKAAASQTAHPAGQEPKTNGRGGGNGGRGGGRAVSQAQERARIDDAPSAAVRGGRAIRGRGQGSGAGAGRGKPNGPPLSDNQARATQVQPP